MNISTLKTTVIGSLLFGLTSGVPAEAAFMVLSQSVEVNLDSKSALFQIEFNRVPDFFTVDEYNRPADGFQYHFNTDEGLPFVFGANGQSYGALESLMGTNPQFPQEVVISDVSPDGSMRPIRGTVPYTLSDNILSVLVPLELIEDDDGKFSYRLEWYEYGAMVGNIEAETVPEPATIFGSFMALGGVAAFQKRHTKRPRH